MTTFDESEHPRNHPTGRTRFSKKENSGPEALLDPSAMTLDQISDELDKTSPDREFALGVSAVKQIVLAEFPTAAEIEVWNAAEGDAGMWIAPSAIRDANGVTLWDSENDWESDFFEELSEWTPLLDRMGSSALFQPGTAADPAPWLGLKIEAAKTGPDHRLEDIPLGHAAATALTIAAAGGQSVLFNHGDRAAADVDRAVEALGHETGKHIVTVGPLTTTREFLDLIAEADGGILYIPSSTDLPGAAIDALREPLTTGVLTISRGNQTTASPARIQLVLGAAPDDRRKFSGPILDRVGVRAQVPDNAEPFGITRADFHDALDRADEAQRSRYAGTAYEYMGNADIPGAYLRGWAMRLPWRTTDKLDRALEVGGITMRGYDRMLRAAWTLADLDGVARPTAEHITRAMTLL